MGNGIKRRERDKHSTIPVFPKKSQDVFCVWVHLRFIEMIHILNENKISNISGIFPLQLLHRKYQNELKAINTK